MRHRFEMKEFDRRETEEEFDALLAGAQIVELPAR